MSDFKDWEKHISKYYGAMFECGDFDALCKDVEGYLKAQKAELLEEVEKAVDQRFTGTTIDKGYLAEIKDVLIELKNS